MDPLIFTVTLEQRMSWGHDDIAGHAMYVHAQLKAHGIPTTPGLWPVMVQSGVLTITYDAMFDEHTYEWREE